MGKKSGRFINPADQQRKLDRKKELKKNKKQRVETREALVKAKDPEEIIDQLRHVDEQIYDPDRAGKETLQAKRKKTLASFYSIIGYARAQKNTSRAKELQNMIDAYENERRTMEEKYNAVMFAREGNLNIPLPEGFSLPNDAMTPASMIPVPPPAPKIHAGILKKPVERKFRKTPPGPPCIPPPEYDDYGDMPLSQVPANTSVKRVQYSETVEEEVIDDYEPVEIPAEIYSGENHLVSMNSMFPSLFMGGPTHPPPIPLQQPVMQPPRNRPPANSVISAPAQVAPASAIGPSQPVIAAGPQMRDLWKETTRFVPVNLQSKKPISSKPKKTISYSNPYANMKSSINNMPANKTAEEKSKDEVCDEFLASLGDLL